MNIIDERDVRTVYRKLRKKEYDEQMKLSVETSDRVRLLDEGMVVDAGGRPLFYIKKGTLAAYLEALPDDFEGHINLGHMDFATFPMILGRWSKKDFHLADIGDGRQALYVDLHLDEESFIVKELRRQRFTLGVSAEFAYHVDERNSKKYQLEILDKVFIKAFAVVGEAGNVYSSDIELSMKGADMTLQELADAIETEQPDLAEVNKKLGALLESEEPAEEPKEEPAPKEEEPAEEPEKEESVEHAPKKVKEETLSVIASLVENLTKENTRLEAENKELKEQLSARDQAEKEFLEKFKSLSISLSTERATKDVEESTTESVFTDGIGEL